jgi:hypothetical protein
MDDREVGRLWNENAEAWTNLARQGHDVYRDCLNTPASQLERLAEPTADDATVVRCPDMQDTQVMPYFLHVRCRKS